MRCYCCAWQRASMSTPALQIPYRLLLSVRLSVRLSVPRITRVVMSRWSLSALPRAALARPLPAACACSPLHSRHRCTRYRQHIATERGRERQTARERVSETERERDTHRELQRETQRATERHTPAFDSPFHVDGSHTSKSAPLSRTPQMTCSGRWVCNTETQREAHREKHTERSTQRDTQRDTQRATCGRDGERPREGEGRGQCIMTGASTSDQVTSCSKKLDGI
jgi:hypothetical protein